MRVAILDDLHHAYEKLPGVERLRQCAEVTIFTAPIDSLEDLQEFDALVANRERTPFPRSTFERLPRLRVIAQTGNHAYHIDLEAAREHGVVVAKAAGGPSIGAIELTFALMLAVMRRIPQGDAALRRGEWSTPLGHVLHGKTLGIVGLGQIGQEVARVATAFGMRPLAWSPSLTPERAAGHGCTDRPLDDLLRESDVVTIHASLSASSRGLLDGRRLGLMRRDAYLVNTARGAIVDEAALVKALSEKELAGAALDVYADEPLPPNHPLTRLPNVVLTPHVGWPTDEGYARFADAAADALIAYLDGREVPQFH